MNHKFKKIFIGIALIITVIILSPYVKKSFFASNASKEEYPFAVLKNKKIKLEIADEYAEQVQGLSDRKSLAIDTGMLFIFEQKQVQSFWMKNMNFPIDIVWIDDGKIVHISKNLEPEGESPQKKYNSILPVNYVLEVNANLCEELGLKIGDKIDFNL